MAKEKISKKDIDDIKNKIVESITKDIENKVSKKVIDSAVKTIKEKSSTELKDNFVFEVKNEVKNQIIKEEKRLLRHRTGKIIRRDIVILILLGIIGFMGYLMYKDDYVLIVKDKTVSSEIKEEKDESVKDLSWYKKHYSYLIDNMHLNLPCDNMNKYYLYNKDLKADEINDSIKLSLAYNLLEDNNKIAKKDLENAYRKLFNDSYNDASFQVDCKVYKLKNDFYEAKNSECLDISDYQLREEITNIYEENDNIIIETVMGVTSNNKLYNYHNLESSVSDIFDSIIDYKESLNSYKYTFNNSKQFISIEKES